MEFVTWVRKIILYTEYVSGKVVISNAEPGWLHLNLLFSLLPIKDANFKSLFFSSCKCIKMNPNLKILLPDWSTIKLGLIFTH